MSYVLMVLVPHFHWPLTKCQRSWLAMNNSSESWGGLFELNWSCCTGPMYRLYRVWLELARGIRRTLFTACLASSHFEQRPLSRFSMQAWSKRTNSSWTAGQLYCKQTSHQHRKISEAERDADYVQLFLVIECPYHFHVQFFSHWAGDMLIGLQR
jgi:hypothetical protein